MATIVDGGDAWKLIINTTASKIDPKDGYIDEFGTKGYRAELGVDSSGKHVVMWVEYDKNKNTLDDVAKKVEQLKTCGKCQSLDKQSLNLESIQINGSAINPDVSSSMISGSVKPNTYPISRFPGERQSGSIKPSRSMKDMFADVIFDAYLTRPGKCLFGVITGDEGLVQSALPTNPDEMGIFMNEVIDFMSGETNFVRSPEEAKEFINALRTPAEDDKSGHLASKKKKRSVGAVTTIY